MMESFLQRRLHLMICVDKLDMGSHARTACRLSRAIAMRAAFVTQNTLASATSFDTCLELLKDAPLGQ